MTNLSSSLLAVIGALPSTTSSSLREIIEVRSAALNDLRLPPEDALPRDRASQASKALRILFNAHAVTAQDDAGEYERMQKRNWSGTCWLPAACFVKLQSTLEVALALRIVTFFQASFVVRSGGHNSNPNFSCIGTNGVVLDFGSMNHISLSHDGTVVSVGPGATWVDIYEELEKNELTVVGGRVEGVGVGGLVIGGGMSHFSNRWGAVCDHVKNFEVVLADSRVVNANAQENIDLFRALKGGGPNFGIVTRFDLYTNPDYRLWHTYRVYNASDVEQVMRASVEVQKAMDKDDKIGFFLVVQATHLIAGMLYMGQAEETPAAFRAFDAIEPMMTAIPPTNGTQLSLARATAAAVAMDDKVAKFANGTATVLPGAELYTVMHKLIKGIVKNNSSPSYSLQFTFQPLGAAAAEMSKQKGGNMLNVRPQNQAWLACTAQWTDDEDEDLARSQIRELIAGIEEEAKAQGLLLDFYCMNDATYWQNPLKSYGEESLAFVRETSGKWDPRGVFQKLQSSGFLVSKA